MRPMEVRMPRPALALSRATALAACAAARPPEQLSAPQAATRGAFQPGTGAGGTEGFETGRLTSPEQSVAGPFVLTYLAPGAEIEVTSSTAGGGLGRVQGPLPQPLQVARGMVFRLPAPGDAVYAGYRPMPITRAVEAWVGRGVLVSVAGAAPSAPETWVLREIAADHVTLERSRTYRVIPIRRIAEITWTDLAGIDPTPRLVLAPE